jgi:hypothetical protein
MAIGRGRGSRIARPWVVTLTWGDQRGGPSSSRYDLTRSNALTNATVSAQRSDITSSARQPLPDHPLVLNVFGPSNRSLPAVSRGSKDVSVCNHSQPRLALRTRGTVSFGAHDWPGRCLSYKVKCLSRCGVSSSGMTTRWFERRNDSGCAASTVVGTHRAGRSGEHLGRARPTRDPCLPGAGIRSLHCATPNIKLPHDAGKAGHRAG